MPPRVAPEGQAHDPEMAPAKAADRGPRQDCPEGWSDQELESRRQVLAVHPGWRSGEPVQDPAGRVKAQGAGSSWGILNRLGLIANDRVRGRFDDVLWIAAGSSLPHVAEIVIGAVAVLGLRVAIAGGADPQSARHQPVAVCPCSRLLFVS